MTITKQPYDMLVGDRYHKDGEEKIAWCKVGTCFELDSGGFSCAVIPGLALTGEFIIKERTPKKA